MPLTAVKEVNKDLRYVMTQQNKKAQELEARNIMQGLEEFANFVSFSGNHSEMRILSVETAEPTELPVKRANHLRTVATHRADHKPMAL